MVRGRPRRVRSAPSLRGIELWRATLTDYALQLDFDLSGYPADPPAKWRARNANTVRIELDVSPLLTLSMTRWGTTGCADLSLTRREDAIELVLDGPDVYLSATVELVTVRSMSAHTDERRLAR